MIHLTIPGRLPSWNQWYGKGHWTGRRKENHAWHTLARAAVNRIREIPPVTYPVTVRYTAYQRRPVMDCSNLCVKPLEDGLRRAGLFADDDPAHVGRVELVVLPINGREPERIVVTIKGGA